MRGGTESGGLAAVTISLSLRLRHCGVTRTGGPLQRPPARQHHHKCRTVCITAALVTYQEIKENGFRSNNEADNAKLAVL